MAYDASSIKILSNEEAEDAFAWLKAETLSQKYSVPLACVQRGLETSKILGMSNQYYIEKYLEKKKIDIIPEFIDVYKTLLNRR